MKPHYMNQQEKAKRRVEIKRMLRQAGFYPVENNLDDAIALTASDMLRLFRSANLYWESQETL